MRFPVIVLALLSSASFVFSQSPQPASTPAVLFPTPTPPPTIAERAQADAERAMAAQLSNPAISSLLSTDAQRFIEQAKSRDQPVSPSPTPAK